MLSSAVLALTGNSSILRNAVSTVVTPAQSAFTWCIDSISGLFGRFWEYDSLKQEIESLKMRLAAQEEQLYQAKKQAEENENLKNYLELKSENIDFTFCDARVIGREAGNYLTFFTLNRGSLHGIEKNMPVIEGWNVVGYITEVGLNWSKVMTFIETASSVGCYVERTGELGVVKGDFSYKASGLCRLYYLPEEADVQEGDRIITSGNGDIYPAGLVVGTVSEVLPDEFSRSIDAIITPSADLSSLRRVMIITSFNITYGQ